MTKKLRIIYLIIFTVLFLTEIFIALIVHDNFIRSYIGDVLVTILICSLLRIFVPQKVSALPIYVFVFALFVELCQYFDVVKLLGMENSALISTLVGRTFSVIDLVCYAVGCIVFWLVENAINKIT